DACRAAEHNPCAVGTCVNDGKGSYSCVCPSRFRQGTTVDGTFSCGPVSNRLLLPTPTEPCAAAFQALNPGLDCSGSGELVDSQAAGETCDQIRSVPSPPLSPLELFRLNPGIKCSRLVPKTDVGSLTGFEVSLCSPPRTVSSHHPLPSITLPSSSPPTSSIHSLVFFCLSNPHHFHPPPRPYPPASTFLSLTRS
ncbi:unnamed protein product, partial [Closterium sp. Naga37s-1]